MHKNNLFLIVLTVTLIFTVQSLFSQGKETIDKKEFLELKKLNPDNQKLLDLENKIVFKNSRFGLRDSIKNDADMQPINPNEKSPYLGALFSGLIPGTGEFYAKSYVKSAIFLGLEAGLWVMYAVFQNKGNTQTDFFQNYANQNWDMRRYATWLKGQSFPESAGIDITQPDNILRAQINACEEVNFSHTLPPFGEQQYYEVIGKYENFLAGWSTAGPDITKSNYFDKHLPQDDYYMTERQKANDYYNNGSMTLTGVILNHVISMADAVWSVHNYNGKLRVQGYVDFKSKFSVLHNEQVLVPHANLVVNF
jgi:hypothetical protein